MTAIYLDNNATTAPAPDVIQAMNALMESSWANPSSVHRLGQTARNQVDLARAEIAGFLQCRERELIFTSGATEANNAVIHGFLNALPDRKTIITTNTEHSATAEVMDALEKYQGYHIIRLPVNIEGLLDPQQLHEAIDAYQGDIALVMIHWANNETGVIQDMPSLSAICEQTDLPIISDATQMIGKTPINFKDSGLDAMTLSAHKFHGPKGIGALVLRSTRRIRPWVLGGPQERERRGGTENTPGIIGMAAACQLAGQWLDSDGPDRMKALRDRLESGLLESVPQARVNGSTEARLNNTLNIAFPHLQSEAILILLSERGICASAGAACSSGSLEPSKVLTAMGIQEHQAHGSIRLSLSRYTTEEDIDEALQMIPQVIQRLGKSMPQFTNYV